jgi:putative sigma-54 modulation protein
MKIEFTGRQTGITPELRRLAERKLQKVARFLPSVTRAHVILTADKHRQVAEVGLHSQKLDLTAVEVSTDPQVSVKRAVEKILRQAERRRSRRRERKGAASPRKPAAPPEHDRTARPRVIRSRRTPVETMTVDEATLQMEARRDGVLVFREAASDRVYVLFRRRDGNLGLIEPEA